MKSFQISFVVFLTIGAVFGLITLGAYFVYVSYVTGQEMAELEGQVVSGFVVVVGAEDIWHSQPQDGAASMSYEVEGDPEEVLEQISTSLQQSGWSPIMDDWLNPGLPSSHVTGWVSSWKDLPGDPVEVVQWQGQWTRKQGVVEYRIQYTPQEGSRVSVSSSVYSSALVNRVSE